MSKNLNLSVQSIQDALRTYLDNSFLEEHEDLRGEVANLVHYTPYQVWWEAEITCCGAIFSKTTWNRTSRNRKNRGGTISPWSVTST